MARFYLDEDTPVAVRTLLAGHGHDVVHAYDLGRRNIPDTEHLLYAAQHGQILITFNRLDFRELHRVWTALNTWSIISQHHAGILTSWGQIPALQWADLVHGLFGQDRNLDNQMLEWRRQQLRGSALAGRPGPQRGSLCPSGALPPKGHDLPNSRLKWTVSRPSPFRPIKPHVHQP